MISANYHDLLLAVQSWKDIGVDGIVRWLDAPRANPDLLTSRTVSIPNTDD